MAQTQFSVTWNAYTKNICKGLSSLQQRGEFVDMTLAADGHLVRVHRMVLSLVSPYIKQLIASADCSHPVIFLNQISYETLSEILEYVYTGEVVVGKKNIENFMNAGQALGIKGLEDLSFHLQPSSAEQNDKPNTSTANTNGTPNANLPMAETSRMDIPDSGDCTSQFQDDGMDHEDDDSEDDSLSKISEKATSDKKIPTNNHPVQFTVSSHGNLQLLLNRYLYNMRYSSRNSSTRRWQCVDGHWKGKKCPASVITKDGAVVKRIGIHNHQFHDAKILKKVKEGTIFAAIHDAVVQGVLLQKGRHGKTVKKDASTGEDD